MELWLSARLDGTRHLFRGVFNPYRRCEKLLLDYVNTLGSLQGAPNAVRFSSEYLSLLMMSEDLARKCGAESVQFMIAEVGGPQYNRFKVILISDKHPANMASTDEVERLRQKPMGTQTRKPMERDSSP